ncbi:MAG: 4,5-DOPA dioxygenase extradiol [Chloroflexi bacterium RBG_13_50_21]|nr:MAG: 4,5-DOPA dioxygenase extradiol [Chloroflexi bacterium RBG_13_50_21]
MVDQIMPALFIGHGNPMNAIEDNEYSRAWQEAAKQIPKPKAILCISAHWETHGTQVTAMEAPPTIHDFFGFPRALFEMQYPAPGSPELANRVIELVKGITVQPDLSWGLDHGAWSVLCRMYPGADVPVAQLSLDRNLDAAGHYALGRELGLLRREGVLIVGSGNLVHNLRMMVWEDAAFDWAVEYDANVSRWILERNHEPIIHYEKQGKAAMLAVNSAEHYLPLLYTLGVGGKDEPVSFFAEKLWGGSLSMRCVRMG